MERLFLMFLDHTQRRTTVDRTPLDEWSARRRDLYLTTHNTHNRKTAMLPVGFEPHDLSRRAAEDLRLRPRGQWDRPSPSIPRLFTSGITSSRRGQGKIFYKQKNFMQKCLIEIFNQLLSKPSFIIKITILCLRQNAAIKDITKKQ